MNETDGIIQSKLSGLEELFPGYTYYLIAYCTLAFFTPWFERAIFGQTSYLRWTLVIVGGAALFVFMYRSTYIRVFREWWGGSGE